MFEYSCHIVRVPFWLADRWCRSIGKEQMSGNCHSFGSFFFKDLSMRSKPVVYPSERWVTMDYSNITCQNVTETIVLYPAHQPKLSILQGNIIAIYLTVVGKFLTFWYIPPPPKKMNIYRSMMRYNIFLFIFKL